MTSDKLWLEAAASTLNNSNSNKKNGPMRKVPGEVTPMGHYDHEKKAFNASIQKKSTPELQTILTRQTAILANDKLIAKLADKGAKVKYKQEQIEKLVKNRTMAEDEAADLLQNLSLHSSGTKLLDIDAMEWKHGGGMFQHLNLPRVAENDSDDDEDDSEATKVLKVLASKEVPTAKKSAHYTIDLVSRADSHISDDSSIKNAPFNQVKRIELDDKSKAKILLKHQDNVGIKSRKVEVMPLPPANYERLRVQSIDLSESLALQAHQATKYKAIQMQNAIEKLTHQNASGSVKTVKFEGSESEMMAYRDNDEEYAEHDQEEEDS